jgi:hypothetical protein
MAVPPDTDERQVELMLQSVLDQTFHHVVLYVIGHGHTGLEKIMEKIQDARVRYWNLTHDPTKPTESLVICRNYALKMLVSTTWVTYLDSHGKDTWGPKHIKMMFEKTKASDPDIVLSIPHPKKGGVKASQMLHKRFLLETYGYWERSYEDDTWDILDKWIRHGARWITTPRECE